MRSPTMYDDGTTRTPREPDDEEEIRYVLLDGFQRWRAIYCPFRPAYVGAMRSRANSCAGTPNRVEDEEP